MPWSLSSEHDHFHCRATKNRWGSVTVSPHWEKLWGNSALRVAVREPDDLLQHLSSQVHSYKSLEDSRNICSLLLCFHQGTETGKDNTKNVNGKRFSIQTAAKTQIHLHKYKGQRHEGTDSQGLGDMLFSSKLTFSDTG